MYWNININVLRITSLCTNQLSHGQGFLRENELRLLLGAFFVGQALQGMTHIENPRIELDEWPKCRMMVENLVVF